MQYASKPSVIEAVQWTGTVESLAEVIVFCGDKCRQSGYDGDRSEDMSAIKVELLAGKDGAQEWVPVPQGHWLVNAPDDKSDIWPVDPDYFANKYVEYDPDGFTLADFRAFGFLWLLNKSVLHPRGFAMGIDDEKGTWSIYGDGVESWWFWNVDAFNKAVEAGADPAELPEPVDEDKAKLQVETFLAEYLKAVEEADSATKG